MRAHPGARFPFDPGLLARYVVAVVATLSIGACDARSSQTPPEHGSATVTATTPAGGTYPPATLEATVSPASYVDVASLADAYGAFDEPGARFRSLEHLEWLTFCAEAFGFTTEISTTPGSPPSMLAHVTRAQLERWAEVNDICTSEAVQRGWVAPQPQSPEELRTEYRRLLDVNDCLAQLGYGTQPPSEDAFVEGFYWNVYANTPRGGRVGVSPGAQGALPPEIQEQLEIQEQCPSW